MKAVIVGAGRIGRGFVTELLAKNRAELTFFDYDEALVAQMRQRGSYTVHVLGHADKDTLVSGYEAYSIADETAFQKAWTEADFVFTAVGGKNLPAVAARVAAAYRAAGPQSGGRVKNIITCENWIDPARKLRAEILELLGAEDGARFGREVGVSEAVVMASGVAAPPGAETENPVDTWVQDFWHLPVDRSRIAGPVPVWECIEYIDGFGDLLQQKLYTNNTSVALIAYLGYLKGHTYVAEAANDPEIEAILDQAYGEIETALVKGLGIDAESQKRFAKRAKEKYQNREIIDVLVRIARDPIRKLQPSDRLIGPAKLALGAGIRPAALALATAAAIYYDEATDVDAVRLQEMRERIGARGVLRELCGLAEDEPLYAMIVESIAALRQKGWLRARDGGAEV